MNSAELPSAVSYEAYHFHFKHKLLKPRARGYKIFFLPKSAKQEIYHAQKTKIPTNEEVSCLKQVSQMWFYPTYKC